MKSPTIVKAPPTDLAQQANVTLNRPDFEAQIYNKGYEVLHEKALHCPCKMKGGDNTVGCRNCLGSGYVFVRPIKTKMLVQNINQDTQYKDWSELRLGTISLTARYEDILGYMDRITLLEAIAEHNEVIYLSHRNGGLYSRTTYEIAQIKDIRIYEGPERLLKKLDVSALDITIKRDQILIQGLDVLGIEQEINRIAMTISYEYNPQYHVLDISREIMRTPNVQCEGTSQSVNMPQAAIARRAHYVLDANNYDENLVIFND